MADGSRKPNRLLAPVLVFIAGTAMALALFVQYLGRSPFARVPLVDGQYYWLMAYDAVLLGKGLPPVFFGAPAYPFLLMGIMALAGPSLALVYLVQIAFFIGSAFFIYDTTRRIFSRGPALAAAALMLLYGPFAFYALKILPDTLGVFLVCAYLNLCVRQKKSPSIILSALVGILAGAEILCRGQTLPLVILTFFGVFSRSGKEKTSREKLSQLFFAVFFLFLTLAPWAFYMKAQTGRLTIFLPNTGLTLLEGNNPASRGTYARVLGGADNIVDRVPDMVAHASAALGRQVDVWEADRYFRDRAISYIRENPGGWLLLLLKKMRLILWPREVHDIFSQRGEARAYLPLLHVFFAGFGLLLPLSCLGAWGGFREPGRERGSLVLLLLAALGICATLLVFFVNSRYRLLLLPALAPLAGNGVFVLKGWAREKRRAPLAASLLALALLFGLQVLPAGPAGKSFRASQAKALAQAGKQEEALAVLRGLVQEHPDDGDAMNSLTVLLLWQGELARAEEAARRLSAMPGLSGQAEHYLWLAARVRESFALGPEELRVRPGEEYHAFLDRSAEEYFRNKSKEKPLSGPAGDDQSKAEVPQSGINATGPELKSEHQPAPPGQ